MFTNEAQCTHGYIKQILYRLCGAVQKDKYTQKHTNMFTKKSNYRTYNEFQNC